MTIAPKKELSLFDSMCIIVGIVIGAGIYETAPIVAACMGGWAGTLIIWVVGGLLALTGALCYAELATTYPREGGDYVYQSRAYGSWAGYLFGWSQLVIIRPAAIALMAFVFARYAQTVYAPFEHMRPIYAMAAVVVLTAINVLGVKQGRWTQNLLTVIKALGLLAIVAAGMAGRGAGPTPAEPAAVSLTPHRPSVSKLTPRPMSGKSGGIAVRCNSRASTFVPRRNRRPGMLTSSFRIRASYRPLRSSGGSARP